MLSKKKLKKQKKENYMSKASWAVLFSYLIGGISALYAGNQYNKTLIDPRIPLLIAVTSGVAFSLLTGKYLRAYSGKKFRYYGHLFWSILSFGGFIAGFLFLVNSVFRNVQTVKLKEPIVDVAYVSKRGSKVIEIDLGGYSKGIRFDDEKRQVEPANYLILSTQKGFFGYSIIEEILLTKE